MKTVQPSDFIWLAFWLALAVWAHWGKWGSDLARDPTQDDWGDNG